MARSAYQTRQGQQVLAFLQEHPTEVLTAEDIAAALAEAGVARATVYRHLDKLAEAGLICRHQAEGKACYRYVGEACGEHYHLICSCCGKVVHLDCGHLSHLAQHIAADHGFCLDAAQTVLYGRCADCHTAADKPCKRCEHQHQCEHQHEHQHE
ncbi:MAG: transcriptional repressor [Firmicutes bacterium]|nr:transcriptional repressor [Bacillota bacterium]